MYSLKLFTVNKIIIVSTYPHTLSTIDTSGPGLASSTDDMNCLTTMPFGQELFWTNFACGCRKKLYWISPILCTMYSSQYSIQRSTILIHRWLHREHLGLRIAVGMCSLEDRIGNSTTCRHTHTHTLYTRWTQFFESTLKNFVIIIYKLIQNNLLSTQSVMFILIQILVVSLSAFVLCTDPMANQHKVQRVQSCRHIEIALHCGSRISVSVP